MTTEKRPDNKVFDELGHMQYDYNKKYFATGMTGWHAASSQIIASSLVKHIGPHQFKKGLDVGCGNGFYGRLLKNYADELSGMDIVDCLTDSPDEESYERFILANGDEAKRLTGQFDFIFCSEVIEHVENDQEFFQKLHQMLAPGGVLFLTTTTYPCYLPIYLTRHPRQWSAGDIGCFFLGWMGSERHRKLFVVTLWEWTKGHYHGFSKRMMRNLAVRTGFQVEALDYFHAESIIDTKFFLNPFRNLPCRKLLLPVLRLGGYLGSVVNSCCSRFNIYGRNVYLVAKKRT